ncbi:MAG: cadmium-translocating P-type ATPase [Alphaproteobacteria bacterium]|nr:cadmium-translocating P-type ATPase [Alphaproteobacteria bacterium]
MSIAVTAPVALCRHCGAPVLGGVGTFCCTGCASAYQVVAARMQQSGGLISVVPELDYSRYVTQTAENNFRMLLMVEGMRCAACAFLIERTLNAEPNVAARMNLTTRRLTLNWQGAPERVNALIAKVAAKGYQLMPFDQSVVESAEQKQTQHILRCLAVAGFASGNIMIVADALWAASPETMGGATRDLLHWVSALIALPTVIYAGQPFFASAWQALQHHRTNMDVPIAVALLLTSAMSVVEMLRHGSYVYFDCVTMLIFLLLAGRYLDRQARGRARAAAQNLLTMTAGSAVICVDGGTKLLPMQELQPGMVLQVAVGERIAADGKVLAGVSEIDPSFMTGETITTPVRPGDAVFSGMVNCVAPLQVTVMAVGAESLVGSLLTLMEQAEQGQARYVRLADRIAAFYTPVVHGLALAAFLLWWLVLGSGWQSALLTATTVLIITCPCALGLAVPVVQVLASSRLFKKGMLLKAADALERFATIDTVVFDKTGTLTVGQPQPVNLAALPSQALALATALAAHSRHPLARALASHAPDGAPPVLTEITEYPGQGMTARWQGRLLQLGRRDWCGNMEAPADAQPELWLRLAAETPVRFLFADPLRVDAVEVCATLSARGYRVLLFSGDRPQVAERVAAELGLTEWRAGMTPMAKAEALRALQDEGCKVLMVGDGLNDAAALAAADASLSPSTALAIAQNAADVVFQGAQLAPVTLALRVARQTQRLVKQNFLLALLYNLIAIPLAFAGLVTPLVAAIAMACSSLLVVLNAQRIVWSGRQA